jgi:hypothetical protein
VSLDAVPVLVQQDVASPRRLVQWVKMSFGHMDAVRVAHIGGKPAELDRLVVQRRLELDLEDWKDAPWLE